MGVRSALCHFGISWIELISKLILNPTKLASLLQNTVHELGVAGLVILQKAGKHVQT